MADEVLLGWEAFRTDPKNEPFLKQYPKSAKEPAELFEGIGEDLGSSNRERREWGWKALLVTMPWLTSILHERETREPGWRDRKGRDQQMANRGLDFLSYLHHVFVVEHSFKIHGGQGKDPRPLVNRMARNWQKAEHRKRSREVPLDYDVALKIPDRARSTEDHVIEKITYEEWKRELRTWPFVRGGKELDLFETVYVNHSPLAEVLKSSGIPSEPALRQRFSRSRKQAVADRDVLFSFLLLVGCEFASKGKLPRLSKDSERSEKWVELAKRSVQPGIWLNGVAADGKNAVAVRPLTTGFAYAPAHLYLLAVHKKNQFQRYPYFHAWHGWHKYVRDLAWSHNDLELAYLLPYLPYFGLDVTLMRRDFQYHEKLLDTTEKHLMADLLDTYPTELPGLNDTLAEIRDSYHIWLLSNFLPAKSAYMWRHNQQLWLKYKPQYTDRDRKLWMSGRRFVFQ